MRPGRPSSISRKTREAILDGRAAGLTATQIAVRVGTPVSVVRYEILAARRRGDPRAVSLPPGGHNAIMPETREAILNGWASGRTAPQLAAEIGMNDGVVRGVVSAARSQGDPRAELRNPGAAWRPQPVRFASSRAFLKRPWSEPGSAPRPGNGRRWGGGCGPSPCLRQTRGERG